MTERKAQVLLADELKVSSNYLRAANVELTAEFTVEHYVPTARALDVVGRVLDSLESGRGKAWSLTGPYGAGKSSFALFLAALLSSPETAIGSRARQILREADAAYADRLAAALDERGERSPGFIQAVVTAEREPICRTLARALRRGTAERFGSRAPRRVAIAIAAAEADPRPETLRSALQALATCGSVVIIVDEFGKNLEHFTDRPDEGDLFALQTLAEEAASGAGEVLFFTLQHLAFDDYARSHDVAIRREWAKVQGRFEDIAFVETSDDVCRLIARAIDSSAASPKFRKARRAWAEDALPLLEQLGLGAEFANGVETVESCYPLHPLAVLALPELCARFGQHGRTLLSFLAGAEPRSLGDYLQTAPWSPRHLPAVGLEDVYDFFVATAARQVQASSGASRWAEIDARIRDASALPADQVDVLKVIGVFNLVSQGGVLRASAPMLSLALSDTCANQSVGTVLDELVGRGVVAYRKFADEYRLWQGSDFDLLSAVQVERERLKDSSIAQMLNQQQKRRHVVAGRHSQKTGMLRYFEVAYTDHLQSLPPEETDADGWLVYHVGTPNDSEAVVTSVLARRRPALVVAAENVDRLCDLVLESAALDAVSRWSELDGDWVARREVAERQALLRREIGQALSDSFDPRVGENRLLYVNDGRVSPMAAGTTQTTSPSAALSDVCDLLYPKSPVIQNEMLARRELSSQGAKARRELMTAMIERGPEERLAIEGYGPERAMYEAFLRETGLHAFEAKSGSWVFQAPKRDSRLRPAYDALQAAVIATGYAPRTAAELMGEVGRAPFGITDGPLPVLLLAVLLEHNDDVAVFEDGTYLPDFAADAAERMVKSPARFQIRHFAVAGGRQRVLDLLVSELADGGALASGRNQGLLQGVVPLLRTARRLPEVVRYDETLSTAAASVLNALLTTRDPDQLLFQHLPEACGLKPITVKTSAKDGRVFVDRLRAAIGELEGAYAGTLRWIGETLSKALKLSAAVDDLRADLQALGRRLGHKILDPKLQSFVQLAATDGLDDNSWLEAMGLALSERPPVTWRPTDRERFASALHGVAATIGRLELLYFESVMEPREGFVAQRHTVTRADGTEDDRMMVADEAAVHRARPAAAQIVDDYLEHGADELNAFMLALWAEVQSRSQLSEDADVQRSTLPKGTSEREGA